ncbi:IS110 family transposase [Labrys okinawensis]|uniref:IS110 family transposase n=1 Tax=Labrys okinawensis TaxID=346911 RepID=UPI0039BCFD96
MNVAGIDIGKAKLDVGLDKDEERLEASNEPAGFAQIIAFLKRQQVSLVGVEATGSYGFDLIQALQEAGFAIAQHQPAQIKLYRKMQLKRAKTDVIDAVLIARFTALGEQKPAFSDARLARFAEKLLFLEQAREDAIRLQGRLDRYRDTGLIAKIKADITSFKARAKQELAALKKELRAHGDLDKAFKLLLSIPGIGDYSALVLIIRLPELVHLEPTQIASLVGVAPFNNDSATVRGTRSIAGGRKNIRNALYLPTLAAATQWNPDLKVLYDRLKAKGKETKVAVIAAMRKLLIIARAVLIRGSIWTPKTQVD